MNPTLDANFKAISIIDRCIHELRADPEASLKTSAGIGIRRAIFELENVRRELLP
jgi:hypothetical protein